MIVILYFSYKIWSGCEMQWVPHLPMPPSWPEVSYCWNLFISAYPGPPDSSSLIWPLENLIPHWAPQPKSQYCLLKSHLNLIYLSFSERFAGCIALHLSAVIGNNLFHDAFWTHCIPLHFTRSSDTVPSSAPDQGCSSSSVVLTASLLISSQFLFRGLFSPRVFSNHFFSFSTFILKPFQGLKPSDYRNIWK